MKETELTCEPILLRKPIKLHGEPWDDTAYHWAINLKITTELGSKMTTVSFKTGNGLIEKRRPPYPVTDSVARAMAAGIITGEPACRAFTPKEPDIAAVCYSLASEWQWGDMTFREFCDEGLFGDDDSPATVHDTWQACVRQKEDLERIGVTLELLQRYVPEDY